jgi:hypothetical protein
MFRTDVKGAARARGAQYVNWTHLNIINGPQQRPGRPQHQGSQNFGLALGGLFYFYISSLYQFIYALLYEYGMSRNG